MTIPLLEFIAVLVNIVVFGRLVLRGFHDMAFIVMHIDASASVTVLASGAPKSQPMQLVWEAISERPEYKKLKRRLGAAHTFGPANLMADAASRDKRDVISRISAQMRLEAVQLRVPSSLKETVYKIAQEIKLVMEDKAVKKSAVAAMSSEQLNHEVAAAVLVDQTAVDFDPQKLKEEKAAEWIADRITDKRAEWIADVDAHAGSVLPTVERPLTAAEQSLGLGQANTPDSASYVMQKKLTKMLELPPVYVAIEKIGYELPTGNCTQAYNMGGFRKRSIL